MGTSIEVATGDGVGELVCCCWELLLLMLALMVVFSCCWLEESSQKELFAKEALRLKWPPASPTCFRGDGGGVAVISVKLLRRLLLIAGRELVVASPGDGDGAAETVDAADVGCIDARGVVAAEEGLEEDPPALVVVFVAGVAVVDPNVLGVCFFEGAAVVVVVVVPAATIVFVLDDTVMDSEAAAAVFSSFSRGTAVVADITGVLSGVVVTASKT